MSNNPFDGIETSEILLRYNSLIPKYVELAKEIAPKIEKFGKYRQELQQITIELVNRGVPINDSDALLNTIMMEIQKRDLSKNGPQESKT